MAGPSATTKSTGLAGELELGARDHAGANGNAAPRRRGEPGKARVADWPPRHDPAPVIRSKIQPPVLRSTTLSRKRLLDRLSEAVRSRLTLVVAEAGYGKTTLLADFSARSGVRTLWYRLDPTDADVVTWANYLIAAGREIEPTFGERTLSLLAQLAAGGLPESAIAASLIGELADLGDDETVLVLDDFHLVETSADALKILGRLVEQSPPWLHFVVSTRRRPELEVGRLAAMGDLTEFATDDLRFSEGETRTLFADLYRTPLDADVLETLDRRTRGWAASLQLFYGSIRGRPAHAVRSLARSLSGAESPMYDYLAEEVLATVSGDLQDFLVRASLLDRVTTAHVVAVCADRPNAPTLAVARAWIEEADRLALLTRSSRTSDARQLHPLLREFLLRQIDLRFDPGEVRGMHLRLARAVAGSDPLTACRHFLDAGEPEQAMSCLGSSIVLTMGSGQWGVAADLLDRLEGIPADPAVAAIRARRLIEDGELAQAQALLSGLDLSTSAAEVRAVARHTTLSLDWRLGDGSRLFRTLRDIEEDRQTPAVLRDIAQVFIDASPLSSNPAPLDALARRLVAMAASQAAEGYHFYAAISLHNAAVAFLNAGHYNEAIAIGHRASEAYERLPFAPAELHSTQTVMAVSWYELGDLARASEYSAAALDTGREFADVSAELAFCATLIGDREEAAHLLRRAERSASAGKSDVLGNALLDNVRAVLAFSRRPNDAMHVLQQPSLEAPLDLGYLTNRAALLGEALLLCGRLPEATSVCETGLAQARKRHAGRTEARLRILHAVCARDSVELLGAIRFAAGASQLALLETADVLGGALDMATPAPDALVDSITKYPRRWLPVLRRQLEHGDTTSGRVAATLLDRYGDESDVAVLRAYARTYGKRNRLQHLGRSLARRVSPRVVVHDLGRGSITVGDRSIDIAKMRRRPASVLLYLLTRGGLSANRDQVLEELWPDSDPQSGYNSLNQSLYFLRREFDPWYEDDVSPDYIAFHGDLVWLDDELVVADSVAFLDAARRVLAQRGDAQDYLDIVASYTGQFAPEFEYEEWSMAWRSRLHSTFLELATKAVAELVAADRLADARDIAIQAIQLDPTAVELERRLIWLYWRLGSRSAARAQYRHLQQQDVADGLEPVSFRSLVGEAPPAG